MSRILLDTSAYSALQRGHPEILAAVQGSEEICVNAVVLGELCAGFFGGSRAAENQKILVRFLSAPSVRVVPMGEQTARRYALIVNDLRRAGTPIPTNDIWIAATAMEHGLELLTTDSHYRHVRQIAAMCFASR